MNKEFKDLMDRVERIENREKDTKRDISQLYTNQSNTNKRVEILEESNKRNTVIKDLTDVSKTGKTNFTIKEISDKNGISEYEVRKIQKEEGLSRTKDGRINQM